MTQAIDDVLRERARQIDVEHWTPAHDDEHGNRELAEAARSYVEHYVGRQWLIHAYTDGLDRYRAGPSPDDWPWDERWWKPKEPRRDLVRAAALLIAEIERMDRMEEQRAIIGGLPKAKEPI
jgi:hypothetical protein